MSEEKSQEEAQVGISFGVEPHPITMAPMVSIGVFDGENRSVIRLSTDEALHVAARLSALGTWVFGMEQSAQVAAQQQADTPGLVVPGQ